MPQDHQCGESGSWGAHMHLLGPERYKVDEIKRNESGLLWQVDLHSEGRSRGSAGTWGGVLHDSRGILKTDTQSRNSSCFPHPAAVTKSLLLACPAWLFSCFQVYCKFSIHFSGNKFYKPNPKQCIISVLIKHKIPETKIPKPQNTNKCHRN